MSSWTTIKSLRRIIKAELGRVFKKHEKYTEDTLNESIADGTLGELIDQEAVVKFAFDNSSKQLRELIIEVLDMITERILGPVLKTKYKFEIQQMKNDYLDLINELPKPEDQSVCVLNRSFDEKILGLNGMKQALIQTMDQGFCVMTESSRQKITELINYQIKASFRYAMEEYTKLMIRFMYCNTVNTIPKTVTLIDWYARALFFDLADFSTNQIDDYIKICIQHGWEENLKSLPTENVITFTQIDVLLKKKSYEEVFTIVLPMTNLVCLDYICEHITPNDIFISDQCVLSYDTLLSFVQTLGNSLCDKTYYKIMYLKKAIPFIDTVALVSKERVRFIVKNMLIHLEHLLIKQPLHISKNDVSELYANVKTVFINCS